MIWLSEDKQNIVIKSYPLVLISIVVAIALLATITGVMTGQSVALSDAAIFYGIIIGFLLIHRYKVTIIDTERRQISFYQRNLFVNKTQNLNFDDVDTVDVHYGRGSGVAKGGALVMTSAVQRFNITDSDVHLGQQKQLAAALDKAQQILPRRKE
jgi:hypothetical protein